MRNAIRSVALNFISSFSGKNSVLHVVAILGTYLCVASGFDWFYFTHVQSDTLQRILFPAVVIGGILP